MITRETVRTLRPVRELGDIAEFLDHKRRPIKEADRKPGPYPYFGANGQQGTIDGYLFDEPLICWPRTADFSTPRIEVLHIGSMENHGSTTTPMSFDQKMEARTSLIFVGC